MRLPKHLIRMSIFAGAAMFLVVSASTSHAALRMSPGPAAGPAFRYDPGSDRTQVVVTLASSLCFALSLPQSWRVDASSGQRMMLSSSGGAEIEASIRPVRDVGGGPDSDPASRDAAQLQRDHENLFGRPPQSVSLVSLTPDAKAPGAKRWTATWIDGSLPSETHAMTLETFIVPVARDWLLELSLTNVRNRAAYEALAGAILAGLKPAAPGECPVGHP